MRTRIQGTLVADDSGSETTEVAETEDAQTSEVPETTQSQPAKRGLVHRAGQALRRAITPAPEEPVVPVPPPVLTAETPRLFKRSPFIIGFLAALGVLLAVGLAEAVIAVKSILILVVLALFLALGLSPAVDALTRRRVPRTVAVSAIGVVALTIIITGVSAIVPIITEQATRLVQSLPAMMRNLASHPQLAELEERYQLIEKFQNFIASGKLVDGLFGGIMGAGQLVANTVFSVIVTLVLTIYFLASLPSIKEAIYSLAPASRRPRAKYLADEIFRGISGYLMGMTIVVFVAGTCSFIFLNIIGLGSYALALSLVVAMLCFIPVVGSFIAMGVVSLVAFATSPTLGLITLIYFLIYTQVDAYLIYPNVMKRAVKVPGALVVLSALIGGTLLGLIGVVIAIPTTAALLLLYREIVQPTLDAA